MPKGAFRKVWAKRAEYPEQAEYGLVWYEEAPAFALDVAKHTGYSLFQVMGVTAVLSAQRAWDANKKQAADFIHHYHDTGEVLYVNTGANCHKAARILECDGEQDTVQAHFRDGIKTSNFLKNMLGDGDAVTLDGHMLNMWNENGRRVGITRGKNGNGPRQPTVSEKAAMLAEIRAIAKENDLTPAQIQAVLWEVYRAMPFEDGRSKAARAKRARGAK